MFQFPQLFPNYVPHPIDLSNAPDADKDIKPDQAGTEVKPSKDVKPDVKPGAGALRGKAKVQEVPLEGRIGTLVVMKSGKVKMVMGNDIVMNVS
jgi:DNA-directed RNA polymerase III subunit RPC4